MFDFLRRKIGKGLTTKAITIGTNEVYTSIDTETAISEGYNANTAVFSILSKDAQKFAAIPQYLIKETEDDVKEKVDNELFKLLNRPNSYQGADSFRELARTYYKLTGEAFIWLNRGDLGDLEGDARLAKPVLEMYVLPSDYVIVVPDPADVYGILGYVLELGGTKLKIAKEDIIHWKTVNLNFDAGSRTHLRGFSPLTAGYKTLQQNNDATAAAVRMYQNDGAKGLAYSTDWDRLSPAQGLAIQEVLDRKINGTSNKGRVVQLNAGQLGYIDLGKSNADLGLLEGKNVSMQELCFLFDVPYEFFDSKTTFANKEQAQKGWITNSIIPACKQFDDELNRVLLQAFGLKGLKIESDYSELPELQKDYSSMVTSLATAWWLTGNEKRDWMDMDKLENPVMDQIFLPAGYQPAENMDAIADRLRGMDDTTGI